MAAGGSSPWVASTSKPSLHVHRLLGSAGEVAAEGAGRREHGPLGWGCEPSSAGLGGGALEGVLGSPHPPASAGVGASRPCLTERWWLRGSGSA